MKINRVQKRILTKTKILNLIKNHKKQIRQFDVTNIGVFGSVIKGTVHSSSDIDILVDLKEPTFDKYMDLKFFLEDLFEKKVDLVLKDSIKPRLKNSILKEVIYAQGF